MNAAGAMRVFRDSLVRWIPYIQRATHITNVSVSMEGRDVVVLMVAQGFEYRHRFTVQSVYGSIGTRPVHPHQKICRFADDLILATLEALRNKNVDEEGSGGGQPA